MRWRCAAVVTIALAAAWPGEAFAQELERGIPPCSTDAVEKAKSGAERGEAAGIYLLARYYSTGKCIGGDGSKAVELYSRAADLGYAPAFYNLGIIFAANRRYKDAETFFRKGTDLGHRGCELQLGILYSFPIPDVGDNAKAFAWLSLSASRPGYTASEAKEALANVSKKLTTSERGRGEALLAELKPQYASLPEFKSE